jgi:hypothetical protein
MFHAIGKQVNFDGHSLRKLVSDFIKKFPDFKLHDQSIRDWIQWDLELTPEEYSKRLENGQWGGALETTILSSFLRVPIFIYEPKAGGFCSRIAEARPDLTLPTLKSKTSLQYLTILYVRKSHYMILEIIKF